MLLSVLCLVILVNFFPFSSTEILTSRKKLLEIFPWYHTTSMISRELHKIAAVSPFIQVKKERIGKTNQYIDIVAVKKGNPKYKFFLLAGEHARELITPESALHFVKALDGRVKEAKEMTENVLKDTQFLIVVNSNPLSRIKVEEGDYCLRSNENGVDLNRNWGDHWERKTVNGEDTNPGINPFSEPEVQILRRIIKNFNPHTFLTIHSGTLGMYMPFAYIAKLPKHKKNMFSILKKVDSVYCKCPFGSAGAEVGYRSYGTSLDYVYEKLKVPFCYAFEIYANKEEQKSLHASWELAAAKDNIKSLINIKSPLEFNFIQTKFRKHKITSNYNILEANMDCFKKFNPGTEEEYKKTLNNWTKAYLAIAEEVVKKLK